MQINFYLELELTQQEAENFAMFQAVNVVMKRLPDTDDPEDIRKVPLEVYVTVRALERGTGKQVEARATF